MPSLTTRLRTYDSLFIGGRWVPPSSEQRLDVVSPVSERVLASVPAATAADVDEAVLAARAAFDQGPWPKMSVEQRIAALRRFETLYAARVDEMAHLVTAEMGSPIAFSRLAQSAAPSFFLSTALDLAEQHPWIEHRPTAMGGMSVVRRLPVGVVAAVIPWNVPQVVLMSKLIPALVSGCTVVVKPAPETPLDALLVAELLEAAELPPGVVSVLPAGTEASEHLVRHPLVDKIAFTGSTAVGRRIAAICGAQLKRVSLELGGKSAAIVLDDADLDKTVKGLRFASFLNSGQACAAQSRVLVSETREAEFVDAIAAMADSLVIGDPFDDATEIGPLVSRRHRQRVTSYIGLGIAEGARVVSGGIGMPDDLRHGWYVRPTVFAGVDNGMRIAREEIFGPVLVVLPYRTVDEAVQIANDSDFGLAGSVWTADRQRGSDVACRVRTGTTAVNHYGADFGSPFGGFKASGIGREYGPEGLDEFVEMQSLSLLPT